MPKEGEPNKFSFAHIMFKPLALEVFPSFMQAELERMLMMEGIYILDQFTLKLNHEQAVTLYEAENTPPEEYYEYLTSGQTRHFIVAGCQEEFYETLHRIRGKWLQQDLSSSGIRGKVKAGYEKAGETVPPYENAIHMTLNTDEFACSVRALDLDPADLERQTLT